MMGGMHGEVAPGLLSYSATRVPCCFRDSKVMPHPQAPTSYHIPGYLLSENPWAAPSLSYSFVSS